MAEAAIQPAAASLMSKGSTVRTADGGVTHVKSSYAVEQTNGVLYTGGVVLVSSDERHLFTIANDLVKIVDLDTGAQIRTLEGDTELIMCMALSPDNKLLVTSSRSLLIRVWDWRSGECVRLFKAHDAPVVAMDFHGAGALLATGSADATVKVWDIVRGYCTHNFRGSSGVVGLVKFHPDPKKLILFSSADDSILRSWDLQTSKPHHIYKTHVSLIRGLAFDADHKHLYTVGRDKIIACWDADEAKLLKAVPAFETLEAVFTLPSSMDLLPLSASKTKTPTTHLATAGDKGQLRVWAFPSGECVYTQPTPAGPPRQLRAAFPIGDAAGAERIITVSADHNIVLYRAEDAGLSREKQIVGYNDEVIDLRLLGRSDSHLAIATNSDEIRVLERKTGDTSLLCGHTDIVMCLDASPDGRILASSSKDRTIRLWAFDADTGVFECVAQGCGHADVVGAVALAVKKTTFVISGSKDTTIKRWDLTDVQRTDPATGLEQLHSRYTRKAHAKDINAVAVAPNDKFVASGSQDRTIKIWRAEDGKELGVMKGHKRGVWCVQFSPVDQVLASSSGDQTIKIWSLADYTCLKTFEGHTHSVLKVAFVTRGMQLLSSGSDGLLKLWTIKTNENVATMDGHTEKVWALTVGRDDTLAVSGGADSVINIWRDNTLEQQANKHAQDEREILLNQELLNLLDQKLYSKAVKIALSLRQPHRLLKIIEELMDSADGLATLQQLPKDLSAAELADLLAFMRDWNTTSKRSHIAQHMLTCILKAVPPADLLKIPQIGPLVEGFMPYTERHMQRYQRLQEQTCLLDYTWQAMRIEETKETEQQKALAEQPEPVSEPIAKRTPSRKRKEADGEAEEDAEPTNHGNGDINSSGSVTPKQTPGSVGRKKKRTGSARRRKSSA